MSQAPGGGKKNRPITEVLLTKREEANAEENRFFLGKNQGPGRGAGVWQGKKKRSARRGPGGGKGDGLRPGSRQQGAKEGGGGEERKPASFGHRPGGREKEGRRRDNLTS